MRASVDIVERSVETTHVWINDLAERMGTDDSRQAYRTLRAFLHTLRDRLPADESAQLAAQLPTLIRGVFYEGWSPARVPQRYRSPAQFLDRVAAEARLHGETEASFAVDAAMAVLRRHVSAGEIEDVLRVLPQPIRDLLSDES